MVDDYTPLIPTTVSIQHGYIESEGYRDVNTSHQAHPQHHTPPEWLNRSYDQSSNITPLIMSLQNGTARVVSDGSYHPDKSFGTAAWMMEDDSSLCYVKGDCVVPGSSDQQCPH